MSRLSLISSNPKSNTSSTSNNFLSPTHRVFNWNLKRNNLHYNIDLESSMLSEEAREFFEAEHLVDRFDAWADFVFVAMGTVGKYMAMPHKDIDSIVDTKDPTDVLLEWVEHIRTQMIEMLGYEVHAIYPQLPYQQGYSEEEDPFEMLCMDVLNIVITANEQKGTEKNAEGKVQKPEGFVKPEKQIDNLLKKTLGKNYIPKFKEGE